MNFKDFSTKLVLSGDLDPDYLFIKKYAKRVEMERATLLRWLQTKIFVYDTTSEIQIMNGVQIEDVKFGLERIKAKATARENLAAFIENFSESQIQPGVKYTSLNKYLQTFQGIGSWAAWKFADLLEQVMDIDIDFSDVDFREAYEYPLKGLLVVNGFADNERFRFKEPHYALMVTKAWAEFPTILDSPGRSRLVNIQEFETCLCKYHSFVRGRYELGDDTNHLRARLKTINVDLTTYMDSPYFTTQHELVHDTTGDVQNIETQ
jgi:hypothetical protein